MKRVTIKINKQKIDKHIDAHTFKRADVTLDGASEQRQNAAASDHEETLDMAIITEFRDRRDARIRKALKKWLVVEEPEELVFSNVPMNTKPDYIYVLDLDDSFSAEDVRGLVATMDEYIEKGVLHDWYKYAGMDPVDTEEGLNEMLDDLLSAARGKSYGRRPMQPFGPAMFNYDWEDC